MWIFSAKTTNLSNPSCPYGNSWKIYFSRKFDSKFYWMFSKRLTDIHNTNGIKNIAILQSYLVSMFQVNSIFSEESHRRWISSYNKNKINKHLKVISYHYIVWSRRKKKYVKREKLDMKCCRDKLDGVEGEIFSPHPIKQILFRTSSMVLKESRH